MSQRREKRIRVRGKRTCEGKEAFPGEVTSEKQKREEEIKRKNCDLEKGASVSLDTREHSGNIFAIARRVCRREM